MAKVLTGRNRTETQRWLSFRAFYGFEAFYCQPGPEGAHEKGGVEGDRPVPPPLVRAGAAGRVAGELNARLAEADAAEDARHIDGRAATVGEDFAAERGRRRRRRPSRSGPPRCCGRGSTVMPGSASGNAAIRRLPG